MAKAGLGELVDYKDLLVNLVVRNITVRYKRSVIGILWTMINPLVNTIVMTIVFSTLFRFSTKDYVIYFLSGIQLWNFFSQSSILSSRCITANGNLLKKVYIPKAVFVLATVLSELVNFALALIPLMILLPLLGKGFLPSLLFLPIPLLIAVAFTLGVSFILAAASVFFYDVGEIYQLLVMPWLYLTPIIYPVDIIPERFLPIIKLNPMYHIVECFRVPIYEGQIPGLPTLLGAAIPAAIVLAIGYKIFTRWSDDFIFYI
jgi:ABC-2 type transport system permease protein